MPGERRHRGEIFAGILLTWPRLPAFAYMEKTDPDAQFVASLTALQMSLQLYVRSLLPGDPMSGDVAQQANTKIWEKRAEFASGTNFKAWAFSIARFEVLNYRKQVARDRRLTFSSELAEALAQDLESRRDDTQERHEALRRCLAGLKSADRELLLHRYASAATLADYGQQVGRSVAGLKVTLHRLRNRLQDCIRRRLADVEVSP